MKKKFIVSFALILCLLQLSLQSVSAKDGKYTVMTKLEQNLSKENQAKLTKGIPNKDDITSCDDLILVYKAKALPQSPAEEVSVPKETPKEKPPVKATTPNTGISDNSMYFIGGGFVLIALGLILISKKSIKSKSSLALAVLLTSSSLALSNIYAKDFVENTKEVYIGADIVIEEFDGYEYIGYILESKECPIEEPELPVVPDMPENPDTPDEPEQPDNPDTATGGDTGGDTSSNTAD